ncbi:nucleotide sugar dehydrogenase [Ferrovibrio sp.]|uniref:nucleotide sugar dehydrogenase n=1 Tax=Ferrovibrio sp. TaxID=1917215 RepID=UPI0035AEC5EC
MSKPVIAYAGMTHLGINYAAAGAAHGFSVIGYDPDKARIADLQAARLPVSEPGLDDLFREHAARLQFSAEAAALAKADIVYIAADVPTDDAGRSDLSPIVALIETADRVIRADALLVVLCQVPPGFTRALKRAPDRLYYQVETLVFGQAVERAMKPERYIVGCARPEAGIAPALAEYLQAFNCPLLPMRYESAELAKISINCCLVASVSVANTLAEICEKIGADWSEIAPALKLDRRIGPYSYLSPGLGIAGGNLERDLTTVCELGNQHGTDIGVIASFIANSRHRRDWVLAMLHATLLRQRREPVLAVWGLAYKQDTHSVKNSPSLAMLAALGDCTVRAFDPQVKGDKAYHAGLVQAADPLDACRGADALAIMTPWSIFKGIAPKDIADSLAGRIVIDPFAVLSRRQCLEAGLEHHTLGVT